MAKRLRLLLKRVGIVSTLTSSASRGFKPGTRWSVSITNKKDMLTFLNKIGSDHPKKKSKLKGFSKIWRKKTFHSMFELAPTRAGILLGNIRDKYNISKND